MMLKTVGDVRMNNRISYIIEEKKITKTQFANRIRVSQAFVSQICSGTSGISNRTIADICREFDVDENWLRTGEGEPFRQKLQDKQMTEFKDRFTYVITEKGYSKSRVAETLRVSLAYVSQICSGTRVPSNRMISDICREFGIEENWLRSGEGNPFHEETQNDQIVNFAIQTVKGSDEFRKTVLFALSQLDADDWENLARICQKVATACHRG